MNYNIGQLLRTLVEQNGSDLHLAVGSPPRVRIDGKILPLNLPPLTHDESGELCYSIMNEEQKKKFEENWEIDFSFEIKGLARFRANVYISSGSTSGAFRLIPSKVFSIDDLQLPNLIKKVCNIPKGLVLVTGATGSGKSTTLAAMVDFINETKQCHIITLEDPIEFVHQHKNSIIHQREIGADSESFIRGLKSILRQDPDVVLLGELRDRESMEAAMTIAETGHLVMATLHTNNCVSSINRIIDSFPANQQSQIRSQLADTLQAVFSQQLLPAIPKGRALGLEIMLTTTGIRALILEGKTNQIYSQIQSGQTETGMQTMSQALAKLVEKRIVSKEVALEHAHDKDEVKNFIFSSRKSR